MNKLRILRKAYSLTWKYNFIPQIINNKLRKLIEKTEINNL